MALVPYEHLTLKTHLDPEAAWWKLAAVVEPEREWPFGKPRQHQPPAENMQQASLFKPLHVLPVAKNPLSFRFSRNHLPYIGVLDGYKFQVRRIIHYRNSFLPYIKGEICPDGSGSSIELIMQIHPVPLVLLVGLAAGAIFIFLSVILGSLFVALRSEGEMGLSLWGVMQLFGAAAIFSLFLYLFVTLPFKYEAHKSIAFFRELFEA
jgi:hypothetical protein